MSRQKKECFILKPHEGGVYTPEERVKKLSTLLSRMSIPGTIETVGEYFHFIPDDTLLTGMAKTFAYEHGFDLTPVVASASAAVA